MASSLYLNLSDCISSILARENMGAEDIVIRFLDMTQTGDFGTGVGLRAHIESMWADARHVKKNLNIDNNSSQKSLCQSKPTIFMGLASTLEIAASRLASADKHLLIFFQWSGAAYLQYGFTKEQLIATAHRVVNDAKAPLPLGLLPTPVDIIRVNSEIRHWLENRRTNVTGMLDDFRNVLRGDTISPFHLTPQPAISEAHRKMVNRLWIYERMAAKLTPANNAITSLRAAMAAFEQAWSAFEAARDSCREKVKLGEDSSEQTRVAISKLEAVIETVCKTIEVTRGLDAALQEKK